MKVELKYQDIREVAEGPNAEALLRKLKQEGAKRAPFLLRGMINAMSDMAFAAEVVKRANAATGQNDPAPKSAQEFLDWGVKRGYVTILEP